MANPETERILAIERREAHWRRWGPYLSGRQWGTVREDYSSDGNAWDSFPFEMSHLRALFASGEKQWDAYWHPNGN